jgi:hypothetical protein
LLSLNSDKSALMDFSRQSKCEKVTKLAQMPQAGKIVMVGRHPAIHSSNNTKGLTQRRFLAVLQ